MRVTVDGQAVEVDPLAIKTMGELVEFVKSQIDPDSVIESLVIDGAELSESDWRAPLSVQGDSVLEVVTISKIEFISTRLAQAPQYVAHIHTEFSNAREAFQQGNQTDGNNSLATAVNDLKAFFQWYDIVLEASEDQAEGKKQAIVDNVKNLTVICEQLVQQQLYNSWWALGETLEMKLEPQLTELEQLCKEYGNM